MIKVKVFGIILIVFLLNLYVKIIFLLTLEDLVHWNTFPVVCRSIWHQIPNFEEDPFHLFKFFDVNI